MIKFTDVTHEYIRRDEEGNVEGIVTALNNISLHIKPGEFVAVLGSNGSGKSTMARHINALLTPETGSVLVAGLDTSDDENILTIRQNAGMVFQNPDNQIIAQTVEEDVAFGPENMGIPTEEIRKRVDESLEKVGMSKEKSTSPNRLSGGQKQRTAIAGILAMKPNCIIFDEPTAMLDPQGRKEVLAIAHELNKKENITIVLITHYMEEAATADRIIIMDKGEIVMDDEPRRIFEHEKELIGYGLELPPLTELAYRVGIKKCVLTEDEFVSEYRKLKDNR